MAKYGGRKTRLSGIRGNAGRLKNYIPQLDFQRVKGFLII
jgi:hypothetical protein